MWLLDKMLRRLIRKGELTVIDHRGKAHRAYMDGRFVVEQGDLRDLIMLIRCNAPFERPGSLKQFYPVGAEAAFRYDGMANFQIQYMKSRRAAPIIRDYLFEEEERLRGLEQAPRWHLAAE